MSPPARPFPGIMMILSPAKTLDLKPIPDHIPKLTWTTPDYHSERTKQVAQVMKQKRQQELTKMLGLSKTLSIVAYEYWQNFQEDFGSAKKENTKPCIFSFNGPAFQGLGAKDCSKKTLLYLQDNLRIMDPVHGALRPLDLIQPYRLEMVTKGVFDEKMSDFWKSSVTQQLNQELADSKESKILLNLASDEYAAVVDTAELLPGTTFVKVIFRDSGRVVAVHAKRARGLMARYLAEANAQTLEDIRGFAVEGYTLLHEECDDTTVVFDRKPVKKQATAKVGKRSAGSGAGSETKTKKKTRTTR